MNTFLLVFIGLPALEIFLMIKIGGQIGAFSTIALVFFTAIVGIYFSIIQGLQTLKTAIITLYQNKIPIYEMISGASIAIAAILLIFPGFFTDLIGFILLIPFTRKILFKNFLIKKQNDNSHSKVIEGEILDKDKDEL